MDVPHFYASCAPFPAIWNQLQPSPFDGFLSTAWALWADGPLAKRVKNFDGNRVTTKDGTTHFLLSEKPPFKMTDEIYAEWQKNWQSLSPLHVKCVGNDEKKLKTYFLEQFSSPKYSTLETKWRAEFEKEKNKATKTINYVQANSFDADTRSKNFVTELEKMKTDVPIDILLSFIIPALEDLLKKIRPP
mgnify:CR=1 FL=1